MRRPETDRPGLYGATDPTARQREALVTGQIPVAVYGLGKMGLPLAAVYADTTGNTVGVDIDPSVVSAIEAGDCPVQGEPGLPELLARTVEEGSLTATADGEAAASYARVHVLIVPTTVGPENQPDLDTLRAALEDVAAGLDAGDLVVVESTVPPGTCRDLVAPFLAAEADLEPGTFGVAFCPERTLSGRALTDIREAYPKIVGGVDEESTRAAALVYDRITDNRVIPVSDATTAEAVKVFEGVYRDVNIALANELARFSDEASVDVREAIEVANTQPYCDIHDPGAGVGGHCIPYYPYFLIEQFATDAPLLRTARDVNDQMPAFTAGKVAQGLDRRGVPVDGATVVLLGLTYRPGVRETRKSPAKPIARRLSSFEADVYGVDPVLDDAGEFAVTPLSVEELQDIDPDAAVMVTAHDAFEDVDWTAFDPMVVVDGRDALDLDGSYHDVYTIGRGWHADDVR